MFNPEVKKQFIEWKQSRDTINPRYYTIVFNACGEYEEIVNKDVCDFNTNDIRGLLGWINTPSQNSLLMMYSVLSQYTTWRIQSGDVKDSQNHYLELSTSEIVSYINTDLMMRTIYTREEILKISKDLENDSDKFLLLALFEGIRGVEGEDILNLKITDIDEENKIFHLKSRDFFPTDELIKLAYLSAGENDYFYHVETWSEGVVVPTIDEGYVFRRTIRHRRDRDYRMIMNRFRSIKKLLGLTNCGMSDIVQSGRIEFILNQAEKHNMSPHDYVYNGPMLEEVYDKFNVKLNKTNMWRTIEKVLNEREKDAV